MEQLNVEVLQPDRRMRRVRPGRVRHLEPSLANLRVIHTTKGATTMTKLYCLLAACLAYAPIAYATLAQAAQIV